VKAMKASVKKRFIGVAMRIILDLSFSTTRFSFTPRNYLQLAFDVARVACDNIPARFVSGWSNQRINFVNAKK
jgi:hypothetical protein